MYMIICYLATGAMAGLMSGLLGVGGGIIVVPALASIFLNNSLIPEALYMKMAIGTSLAVMIVTLSSGVYAHHQHGAVNWKMVKRISPGLVIGVIIGAILVRFLSSSYLSIFFSLFLLALGLRLLLYKNNPMSGGLAKNFSKRVLFGISGLIGILSSVLGAGGGTMWVPFFLYSNLKMHVAAGTSIACGIVAAFFATASFIITGFFSAEYVPWSTSYIYWPAFAGVAIMSVLFSPLGAALAHKLPHEVLRRLFALFLLLVAVDMMFFK